MALPKNFSTKSECPEFLLEYYEEGDDGALNIRAGFELEDVSKLKGALSETKEKSKLFEKQLKSYGEIEHKDGKWEFKPKFDPSKVGDLESQIENYKKQLEDQKDPNEIAKEIAAANISSLKETYEGKIAELNESHTTEQSRLMDKYRETAIDQRIDAAIAQHGGIPHLLRPHVRSMARLDDDLAVVLHDADGKVMIDNDAKNLSPAAYLEKLKSSDEWRPAFNAPDTKGGGGSGPSGGGLPRSIGDPQLTGGAVFGE